MLSKNFKSNKYYEVTRYWLKYGNEEDALENTITVWDSLEKAKAYIERYNKGLKFESATVEEIIVNKVITMEDYKKNNFEIVSYQEVYSEDYDGNYNETPGKIYYLNGEKISDIKKEIIKEEVYKIFQVNEGTAWCIEANTLAEAKEIAKKYKGHIVIKKGLKIVAEFNNLDDVKTMNNWRTSDLEFKDFAKVGDIVDEDIVNWFAECVPPIMYNSDLIQCGEVYGHRDNPRTGRFEGTYITFAKVDDKWIYKGHCFFGEQKNIA